MSKRAEEAAYNYAKENGTPGYDYNQIYYAVKKGYEQAEKDTIERAVEYIKSTKIFGRCFPEDFRKAMEE